MNEAQIARIGGMGMQTAVLEQGRGTNGAGGTDKSTCHSRTAIGGGGAAAQHATGRPAAARTTEPAAEQHQSRLARSETEAEAAKMQAATTLIFRILPTVISGIRFRKQAKGWWPDIV